jgi:hypothetical protein
MSRIPILSWPYQEIDSIKSLYRGSWIVELQNLLVSISLLPHALGSLLAKSHPMSPALSLKDKIAMMSFYRE